MKTPPANKKSSRVRKVIIGVIIAFVALASFYGAMYLLTPYLGFAQALIWMDAAIKDYEKFSARTMNNAPPVFNFEKVDTATQSKYLRVLDSVTSQMFPNSTVSQTPFNEILASTQTTAFLIIKDDRLIYENYFNGYKRDSINTSFSVTKSFVSALVGIAIDEGLIDSIDDSITNTYRSYRTKTHGILQ